MRKWRGFGLSPTGTNEKVRSKEPSALYFTYDLCYSKNDVVLSSSEEDPWPLLYFLVLNAGTLCRVFS
ncbi:hypothetical protein ACSS6W_002674 [Trichoderma asperelloides]